MFYVHLRQGYSRKMRGRSCGGCLNQAKPANLCLRAHPHLFLPFGILHKIQYCGGKLSVGGWEKHTYNSRLSSHVVFVFICCCVTQTKSRKNTKWRQDERKLQKALTTWLQQQQHKLQQQHQQQQHKTVQINKWKRIHWCNWCQGNEYSGASMTRKKLCGCNNNYTELR